MGVGEVYFDVVFADVGVDPGEDLFLLVEENHVLVYDEVAEMGG
jgi:hypothetical protein